MLSKHNVIKSAYLEVEICGTCLMSIFNKNQHDMELMKAAHPALMGEPHANAT